MVNSNTRGILLAQMRKRKELVKLSETFEKLQQIYFEVAFESMSEDEAKLYDLVVNGKLNNLKEILIVQDTIDLSYLLPRIFVRMHINMKPIVDDLNELGIETELLTGINVNYLDEDFNKILQPFVTITFKQPVPLFLGKQPNAGSIKKFKNRCPKPVFDKFIEITKQYVHEMLVAATLLQELGFFLDREDVSLDFIKKNYPELYKTYEDGKEESYFK